MQHGNTFENIDLEGSPSIGTESKAATPNPMSDFRAKSEVGILSHVSPLSWLWLNGLGGNDIPLPALSSHAEEESDDIDSFWGLEPEQDGAASIWATEVW